MTDFEREDIELQAMMGDKFIDATAPMEEAAQAPEAAREACQSANTTPATKAAQKTTQKPTEGKNRETAWHPAKPHNWMLGLASCAKWAVTFGGLNALIFYWQQAGLMAESIAVPCMWVCCALVGYGIGLNVWRWRK